MNEFRERRIKAGWSISSLARALGTSRSTIQRWERGESRPSYKHIEKLKEMSLLD